MKTKNVILGLLIVGLMGATSVITAKLMQPRINQPSTDIIASDSAINSFDSAHQSQIQLVNAMPTSAPSDFTQAAANSINSVVHIKSKLSIEQNSTIDPIFQFFFGEPSTPQRREAVASGSGVIISDDGYIITNNHVVKGASSVLVVLNNKKEYSATIIGVDANTDIALLKIDAKGLPTLPFGNSDNLKVGEWVLAVGNPFNLTSTVTAGIVSAKARNINIIDQKMKIESFIQTDAAVNPGNSGGALVNTKGELIGINTAIASQTGSYTGYSFAIPISIASKVVADIKEFGVVQRAYLGISVREINAEFAKEKNLKNLDGIYIEAVNPGSGAEEGGLLPGDVILGVNKIRLNSYSAFIEQIGRHRPGDQITITYRRKNKEASTKVTLQNRSGNTDIVKGTEELQLGCTFKSIDKSLAQKFRLRDIGLQIDQMEDNSMLKASGIREGFIITKINNALIRNVEDIKTCYNEALKGNYQDKVLFITGIYPNGQIAYYAVNLN